LLSDQSEPQARNALKNLVYRLRTLLGAATINRTPTGYALGTISSDAERFLETADLKIWRGAYLEDSGFESSSETRNKLIAALQIAAQTQLEISPALVVRAGRVLVGMEPYDLTALRLSLQALRASNNRRDLVSTYEAARRRFAEVDTQLPASWQDFLQQTITTQTD
jgi:DNA-binding SARP family transcriptional activator